MGSNSLPIPSPRILRLVRSTDVHESDDATKPAIYLTVYSCSALRTYCSSVGSNNYWEVAGVFNTTPGNPLGVGQTVQLLNPDAKVLALVPTLTDGQWVDISEVCERLIGDSCPGCTLLDS